MEEGGGGGGEEVKEMLACKSHNFEECIRPQMQSSDWCRWKQCLSPTCQHTL